MRSYSQPQIQLPQSPFQIQPMYPPSQQRANGQGGEWGQLFQQQEMKQQENYQQRKQYEQMRKQKYKELLDQDVQAKQNLKAFEKQEDINKQKYWNENEQVISDMLNKQKNAQKLYYQKLCEENLILAQQRQDQISDQISGYPQYQTMEERMNQFRLKEAQIYQNNQKKMEKEYQKIQQMNTQNQQLIEGQKMTPLFPVKINLFQQFEENFITENQINNIKQHQNIIRERKYLHDKCDDVVYEQIKQKEAQKAKEREQKLRERELVQMQAKFLEEQEKLLKEQKKQQYQQYCTDNNAQSQFQKQLQVRDNLMNPRESALNSQRSKTRDKNGIEINPIYSLEYNSYERQKQLNQVDRVLNRLITPNSNLSRFPTMNNLIQVNPLQVNNGQSSQTLVRNGSQLLNRGQSNHNNEVTDFQNGQTNQNTFQSPQVQPNQQYVKKFQNHVDNFNQIRTVNPQSLQNPQVNFFGAQLLHKNVQQESNFIKDSFGIHSNHGYNIISGHVFND